MLVTSIPETLPPCLKPLLNNWKWDLYDVSQLISALTAPLTPRCWRFSQVWCQLLLQHWHQTHRFLPKFMRPTKRSLFQVKGRTLVTTVYFNFSVRIYLIHLSYIQYYIKGHFGRYVQRHFDDIRWSKKSPASEVIGRRSGCQQSWGDVPNHESGSICPAA